MIAEIIIDITNKALDKTFYYKVPRNLLEQVQIGTRVLVPFGVGNKRREGYILGFTDSIDFDFSKLKEIISVLDIKPVFSTNMLKLIKWMKDKYYTTMADCIKCVIPTGISLKTDESMSSTIEFAFLNDENEAFDELSEQVLAKKTAAAKVLRMLMESDGVAVSDIKAYLNISDSAIKTLKKYNLILTEKIIRLKDTVTFAENREEELTLTDSQKQALDFISNKTNKKPILLHGVTGSGKTEIYMRLIESMLNEGKQAIMLVPEISLTPQTVSRFTARFKNLVSVTHSRLTIRERYDQWKKARDGQISIMIGPRSAVFTPFNNLGIIIIDEEHENVYKSETTPKYSAKEVAIERGKIEDSLIVLGSATPSIESYYEAENAEIDLITISNRVNMNLPEIFITDMRDELAQGNKSIFSENLLEAVKGCLDRHEQGILFLNRRGYSTFVSCRKCGLVLACDNCRVNYTYHMAADTLTCHYCGKKIKNPKNCPVCGSKYIKYFGIGTQRVEDEIKAKFPSARVIRMDLDTTKGKVGHEKILNKFKNHEADILVGTQMIAKGLDFPNVSLVGVIAADLSLNNGDFRAAETTYQLLTQVSGRAGRASISGKVFIQTYNSEHYSIVCTYNNDYKKFYEYEISLRRQMMYPPFTKIFSIMFSDDDEKKIITKLYKLLEIMQYYNRKGLFETLGPAPASISKVRNKYKWKLIVKSVDEQKLKNFVFYCLNKLEKLEGTNGILINVTLNPSVLL